MQFFLDNCIIIHIFAIRYVYLYIFIAEEPHKDNKLNQNLYDKRRTLSIGQR